MENLKINGSFQELTQEEAESFEGGLHFVVGFLQEARSVVGIFGNLAGAIAGVADKGVGGALSLANRGAGSAFSLVRR